MDGTMVKFKSFLKTVPGNEGEPIRSDIYGQRGCISRFIELHESNAKDFDRISTSCQL